MQKHTHYEGGTRKLNTLASILRTESDPEVVIDSILERLNKNLHAQVTYLAEVVGQTATIKYIASDGTTQLEAGMQYDISRSPSYGLNKSETRILGNVFEDLPPDRTGFMRQLELQTYMGTHLPIGDVGRQFVLVTLKNDPPNQEMVDGYLQLTGIVSAVIVDKVLEVQGMPEAMRAPQIVNALRHALAVRDIETVRHSRVVGDLAMRIALQFGIPIPIAKSILIQGEIHDVGKLLMPLEVLKKEGPLDAIEREIMMKHPTYSRQILLLFPFLAQYVPGAYLHHKKFDGTGYPDVGYSLIGEDIPLEARILAVADVIIALTEPRSYRNPRVFPLEQIKSILRSGSGIHFDPRLVEPAIGVLEAEVHGKSRSTYWDMLAAELEEQGAPRLVLRSITES